MSRYIVLIFIMIFIISVFLVNNNVLGQTEESEENGGLLSPIKGFIKHFFTPGNVNVTFSDKPVRVCPPGILGTAPCSYPSITDVVMRINEILRRIAPYVLVLLIVLGGLMYILTPFGIDKYIKTGHRYVKFAIIGYVILLLVTLIFLIISTIFGGPSG